MNIQTIIFDLGGVIIDLDEIATIRALSELSSLSYDEVLDAYQNFDFFKAYEKGQITSDEFRSLLRERLNIKSNDAELDEAWNAMLGVLPVERLELMLRLRSKGKQVLILSNTNEIHEIAFNKIIKEVTGKDSLHDFADMVFFSHEIKARKPDTYIYQKVIEQSGIDPSVSVFLDDKPTNLQGAEECGIQTYHIPNPNHTLTIEAHVEG